MLGSIAIALFFFDDHDIHSLTSLPFRLTSFSGFVNKKQHASWLSLYPCKTTSGNHLQISSNPPLTGSPLDLREPGGSGGSLGPLPPLGRPNILLG